MQTVVALGATACVGAVNYVVQCWTERRGASARLLPVDVLQPVMGTMSHTTPDVLLVLFGAVAVAVQWFVVDLEWCRAAAALSLALGVRAAVIGVTVAHPSPRVVLELDTHKSTMSHHVFDMGVSGHAAVGAAEALLLSGGGSIGGYGLAAALSTLLGYTVVASASHWTQDVVLSVALVWLAWAAWR